jgi:alkanesulfonate monooxygenase SsuD/methylene tetrahydromethanopterin reductase-like flavin-dependent oxidoreductase (luciferase family)
MRAPGDFKLGLFGYLHDGANAITKAPERWPARWDDIVTMAQRADEVGLDFLMPIARWKGIPGDVNNRLHSFETLTHAAALAPATRRIAIFATVHTPIVHPIFAAKAMVTIDHASRGRAGLNIVCGWNQSDFDMFGLHQLPHDERYAHGGEWFDIWSRLAGGAPVPFDYDGRYFAGLKGLSGMPPAVQRPHPVVLSASYSPAGRDFAVRNADYLLTVLSDLEKGRSELAAIRARAAALGRQRPLGTIAVTYVVCRKTRAEAEAFHRYYAEEQADQRGVDFYLATRSANAAMPEMDREMRLRFAGGNSGYPLIGTPDEIAAELARIKAVGYDGAALCFLHFIDEVELFYGEVLPRLATLGLRAEAAAA